MITAGALLMVLTGAAILAFGLLLFYAWKPIFYCLLGFDIGLLLGAWLTGETGWIAIILGIVSASILWAASSFLERYRRILLGVAGGFLLGLGVAAILGLEATLGSALGLCLAVLLGAIGAHFLPRLFDTLVIVASSAAGAVVVMTGMSLLFPGIDLLNRSPGRVMPAVLAAALAIIGIIWQTSNAPKWTGIMGMEHDDERTSKPRK